MNLSKGDLDMEFKTDILQLRKGPYENGAALGRHLSGKPIVTVFKSITKAAINIEKMEGILKAYSPHLLDELKGIADGLEIPYHKAAALFSGYDVPKVAAMGCTAVMTKDFYVRNYDFSPEFYDGIFTLSENLPALASAGYNLQAIGRHDGVNEKGLAAGLHFVSHDGYQEGLSAWTSVRMVLDTCATVREAAELLKEIPHAACYNFSLADSFGNQGAVEASPDKVLIRQGPEVFHSCVNHFRSEEMAGKNREHIDGSIKRTGYLDLIGSKQLSFQQTFDLLRDSESPLFFTDYEDLFGTLHTFGYSFQDSQIVTSLCQGDPLRINLKKWLAGKDIEQTAMQGKI
ncbi:peptidase C45 [Bacillus infantis]|nr:peptidase C45 [Bacillus infantis]